MPVCKNPSIETMIVAFWIDDTGVAGFVGYESAKRQLVLNRFRPTEPLPPVEIATGGQWAPQVSMDGRYLILSKGNAGAETFTLYDLIGLGKPGVPTRMPHLEPRFRWPFSVVGASLYFVAEDEGRGVTGEPRSLAGWSASIGQAARSAGPTPCRLVLSALRWRSPARAFRADDETELRAPRADPRRDQRDRIMVLIAPRYSTNKPQLLSASYCVSKSKISRTSIISPSSAGHFCAHLTTSSFEGASSSQ